MKDIVGLKNNLMRIKSYAWITWLFKSNARKKKKKAMLGRHVQLVF